MKHRIPAQGSAHSVYAGSGGPRALAKPGDKLYGLVTDCPQDTVAP